MRLHGRALEVTSSRGRELGKRLGPVDSSALHDRGLCPSLAVRRAMLRLQLPSLLTLHPGASQGPTNHIAFTLHFRRAQWMRCGCCAPGSGFMILLCHFSETTMVYGKSYAGNSVYTLLYRYIFTANGEMSEVLDLRMCARDCLADCGCSFMLPIPLL